MIHTWWSSEAPCMEEGEKNTKINVTSLSQGGQCHFSRRRGLWLMLGLSLQAESPGSASLIPQMPSPGPYLQALDSALQAGHPIKWPGPWPF